MNGSVGECGLSAEQVDDQRKMLDEHITLVFEWRQVGVLDYCEDGYIREVDMSDAHTTE